LRKFITVIAITCSCVIVSSVAAATVAPSAAAAATKHKSHKAKSHKSKSKKANASGKTTGGKYCSLLTTAQVNALLGGQQTATEATQDHGDFADPGCTWLTTTSQFYVTLDVNTKAPSTYVANGGSTGECGVSNAHPDQPLSQQLSEGASVSVPGVGTSAYFCGIFLVAQEGPLGVQLSSPGSPATEQTFVTDVQIVLQQLRQK
jgi:hypothetical protein